MDASLTTVTCVVRAATSRMKFSVSEACTSSTSLLSSCAWNPAIDAVTV